MEQREKTDKQILSLVKTATEQGIQNHDEYFKEIDAVELTPEEELDAIRRAKSAKLSKQKQAAYWANVNKAIEWPVVKTWEDLGNLIYKKIKTEYSPNFIIDHANREIFKLLCQYFVEDPEFEAAGYSLEKGIALVGPVGCGKTTLLKGFNINPTNSYLMVTCRKAADEYATKETGGPIIISKYSSVKEVSPNQYWQQRKAGQFFDDLGTEEIKSFMGNKVNVMAEILQTRYENQYLKGMTHITTNLDGDQIDDLYGPRVRSRIREMMNWIEFDPSAVDRRK